MVWVKIKIFCKFFSLGDGPKTKIKVHDIKGELESAKNNISTYFDSNNFIDNIIKLQNIQKLIYRQDYAEYVEKYAKENNVDPLLIYAIIKAESNFDDKAVSNKGATGLMQLMENTAKEVAINEFDEEVTEDSLCDPETNIRLGVKYFADLMEIFQEEAVALAAYNAGMGTVQGWIDEGIIKSDGSDIENIPYNETNMYVRKILKDYDIYKRLYRR